MLNIPVRSPRTNADCHLFYKEFFTKLKVGHYINLIAIIINFIVFTQSL